MQLKLQQNAAKSLYFLKKRMCFFQKMLYYCFFSVKTYPLSFLAWINSHIIIHFYYLTLCIYRFFVLFCDPGLKLLFEKLNTLICSLITVNRTKSIWNIPNFWIESVFGGISFSLVRIWRSSCIPLTKRLDQRVASPLPIFCQQASSAGFNYMWGRKRIGQNRVALATKEPFI